MRKLILLVTVVLLCLSMSAQSQIFRIGDYGFTNTTDPYAPLVGDSAVAVLPSFNSGITDSIQIGFVFRFGNINFNAFKVQSNGWMTFNLPTTATTTTTPITTTATVHIIAPFARDLDSAGTNNPARVSILRSGVAPNQITKIQWQNFKSLSSTIVPAIASFQVWIYETSNVVELRYGSVLAGTRTGASTVQVGLKSGSTAADSVRTVQGASWPTATVSNTTTSKTIGIGNLPDSNRVYRFTPAQQRAFDVTPSAIVSPVGVLATCQKTIAPKVTVRNVGFSFAAYSVTYQITGPGAPYTSTRSDTLSPSLSRTLTFDSTFSPTVAGTYNLRVFTTFPSDTNSANDTIVGSIQVLNMAGGPLTSCSYFFANSLPCTVAPDKPIFGWLDTTGSTSLVVNNVQQQAALYTGTLDNGFWRLEIPGPDQFMYCGVAYDSFFVGSNGFVAFSKAFNTDAQFTTSFPPAIPSLSAPRPAIFPFWKDLDYGDTDIPINRLSYKTIMTPGEGLVLLITYDRAPNDGALAGSTDYVSFQVILQLAPVPVTDGRIIFQYDDSRTGATFLDKYFNFGLFVHTVGIQDLAGTSAIQYRRVNSSQMANVVAPGPLFATPVAVAFGPNANVLPVELASFTSTVNRKDVTLNWTTTMENNNSGFEVERSVVNGNWSKVGFVQGNGTSTSSVDYLFIDRGLNTGKYNYRLKQIDFNGNFEYFNLSNEIGIGVPTRYDLSQNYPNPFNPTTKINYDLPRDGKVSIKLFDISGREVVTLVNNVQTAGYYTITFDGSNLSSGTYFYRISAESDGQNFVTSKKMILIK